MITCSSCLEAKDQTQFYTNGPGRYRTECKPCTLLRQKANKHGSTTSGLRELWEAQDRACAVCEEPMELLMMHVDHDHNCCGEKATGNYCGSCIRGLLCQGCNWGLGHFRDNTYVLSRAIKYLKK